MLSSHSHFSHKLLLRSDFQGFFAFRQNQVGRTDSFTTLTSVFQNVNFVHSMFQELSGQSTLNTGEVQVMDDLGPLDGPGAIL